MAGIDPPRSAREAQALRGAAVRKQFTQGIFNGKVKSVDTAELPWIFKVVYEDDDEEDMGELFQTYLHGVGCHDNLPCRV